MNPKKISAILHKRLEAAFTKGLKGVVKKLMRKEKTMKRITYKELEKRLTEREKILGVREMQVQKEEQRLINERIELNRKYSEIHQQAEEINMMIKRIETQQRILAIKEIKVKEAEKRLLQIGYVI